MDLLTIETAEQYVRDYFAKIEVKILESSHREEDSDQIIDVRFEHMGGRHIFTVWTDEDGKLYGEW